LGQPSLYPDHYDAALLFRLARQEQRDAIAITTTLPFYGLDIWNAYEISWLNTKGKPIVAMGTFYIPCTSPYLVESKSLKIYLNAFSNSSFVDQHQVKAIIEGDLSTLCGQAVQVDIDLLNDYQALPNIGTLSGKCLDTLDIECTHYQPYPDALKTTQSALISETVYSNLLKSNCLITSQPDWASVEISYTGNPIDHAGLLQYIVSLRNHNEFHEHCVERMFMDILKHCKPTSLSVYARYTRRGGLDINPYRSTDAYVVPANIRLVRQ